jgi:hypothetical protein
MPELRYLRIVFANAIRDYELPYFRAAVIEATRRQHDRFHNHTEDARSIFRYPLVQYKTIGGKAALVCLGEAVDDIHALLEQPALRFRIGSREQNFTIQEVAFDNFPVELGDQLHTYQIHQWLPLNDENKKRFIALTDPVLQKMELSRILTGNLLSFAKGIGYWLEKPIVVHINDILSRQTVKFKDYPYQSFGVSFQTNLPLPSQVGLGKGCSVGYGVVDSLASKMAMAKAGRR